MAVTTMMAIKLIEGFRCLVDFCMINGDIRPSIVIVRKLKVIRAALVRLMGVSNSDH